MPTVRLPDFSEMFDYANKISDLLKRKLVLEAEISFGESEAVRYITGSVLVNGKPPSMEYIKNTYLVEGIDGVLKNKRLELAEIIPELEKTKLMLQISRDMLDVYRTESANERAASLG